MNAIPYTIPAPVPEQIRPARAGLGVFLSLHCLLLLGYALFGKPFAYLGLGNLFVAEIVLGTGTLLFLMSPRQWLALRTWHLAPLLALMLWCAIRTIPYIPVYGVDALRDAAIWGYGWFAVLVAAAIACKPATMSELLDRYRSFVWLFVSIAPIVWAASTILGWWTFAPGGHAAPVLKAAEITVHLSGVVAFIYLRVRKISGRWLMLTPALLATTLTSRGAIVAFLLAIALLLLLRPKTRNVALILASFIGLIAVAALLEIEVTIPGVQKEISIDSMTQRFRSIFFDTGIPQYEGTKHWRLRWWSRIVQYTWHGDYFWTGKGFGINLADADGFQVRADHALRSPHNGHLTLLARAGVPGLMLWLLAQGAWFASILYYYFQFRSGQAAGLGSVLLFLLVYWTAFVANAAFDVFLEGPMAGVWFWTIYGAGVGSVILCRQKLRPGNAGLQDKCIHASCWNS